MGTVLFSNFLYKKIHINKPSCILYMENSSGGLFFMSNYEIMMNGNVKIGEEAPDFNAVTTQGNIKLSDYKGKWLVFFSHPRRFYPCLHN